MTGWFEEAAEDWIAWARTRGHDAYWSYRDSFFSLLPRPGRALDVGCGEGRVCRDLAARGFDVVGIDASPTLVLAAKEADCEHEYLLARAEALPFPDELFDIVVAYNTLMDVEDMPLAVREAARVLRPGGRLCACVTHPTADAGDWVDDCFVINEPYLEERAVDVQCARDGLAFRFKGRAYPLEAYSRALEAAGLLLEAVREPAPPANARELERWSRLPLFLLFRAVKPA